jgi:hypothetical protein
MRSVIDVSAETLRAGGPVFTRRNLFHAVRRARSVAMTEAAFETALRRRLSRGALPGLLPARRRPLPLPLGWDACFPEAVLLVDRPAIRDVLTASGGIAPALLTVVCIDGTPSPVVAWLQRGFREGRRAPVLYLHDAATVVYPFTLEPLATRVAHRGSEPVAYADLGLPPLGATARRFADPTLPGDEPIFELEAIPPATLLRYCAKSAKSLVSGISGIVPHTSR